MNLNALSSLTKCTFEPIAMLVQHFHTPMTISISNLYSFLVFTKFLSLYQVSASLAQY